MFGTVLENVVLDPATRAVDFDDDTHHREHPRLLPDRLHPEPRSRAARAAIPKNIVFLTADAFGVLPPIARLTAEQAMYHFLSGYTAKVAGTERGVTEPTATFSACFGAPFLPLHPGVYAKMLGERIARHGARVWLVNTGWTGGPYGIGSRMKLGAHPRHGAGGAGRGARRGRVHARIRSSASRCPTAVPGRAGRACSTPRSTWADPAAYDAQASEAGARCSARTSSSIAAQVPEAVAQRRRPVGRETAGGERRRTLPRCPPPSDLEVIRDPLWDNIRLDRPGAARARHARRSAPPLRPPARPRLPGLSRRHPHPLRARPRRLPPDPARPRRARGAGRARPASPEDDCLAVRLAALLHDIGHYPFSHALEEAGFPSTRRWASPSCAQGELGERLESRSAAPASPTRVGALITRHEPSPLQGLISGSLDLDKIDYLSRDARMCGVPYGTVDVDRLLASLTLVEAGAGRWEVGVQEKGVSALESLLFAKYQMYRNVYWHHAVRSRHLHVQAGGARRGARAAASTAEAIAEATDDGLMELLITRRPSELAGAAIRARRLYKRALDLPASDVPARRAALGRGRPRPARAGGGRAGGARSGSRRASCCSTSRPAPRCSAVDLPLRTRDGRGRAADRRRPRRPARACRGWPTSSTGARAGSGCSWRARRGRPLRRRSRSC